MDNGGPARLDFTLGWGEAGCSSANPVTFVAKVGR
jgi:hypothetical protein